MSTEPRDDAAERSTGRALAMYNLWRLLLLIVCLGIGALAGLRGLWLVVAALLASGVLSYFLLAKQRIAMGTAVEARVTRVRSRMAERTAAEDEYADDLAARRK